MLVSIDTRQFMADMENVLGYSKGFLSGVESGKLKFLESVGATTIEALKEFVDSNARVDPAALHHVYEWYQVGSPEARLFNIKFTISGANIHFFSNFKQSSSVQDGSTIAFRDKARIMEDGIAVTVTPRGNNPLVFEDGGETVFTKAPVTIENPGGSAVQGSYNNVFRMFFESYFSQAFLTASGMARYLETPRDFDVNFPGSKRGGKALGIKTGYNWIVKAGEL